MTAVPAAVDAALAKAGCARISEEDEAIRMMVEDMRRPNAGVEYINTQQAHPCASAIQPRLARRRDCLLLLNLFLCMRRDERDWREGGLFEFS